MEEFAQNEVTAGRFELKFGSGADLRIEKLPGVGPKTAQRLAERGIRSASDLLLTFPRKYRRVYRNARGETLVEHRPEFASFVGTVEYTKKPPRHSRAPFEVHLSVDGVPVRLVWFNVRQDWFGKQFESGKSVEVEGAIDWDRAHAQLSHPTVTVLRGEPPARMERVEVEPVYTSYEGIRDGVVRQAIQAANDRLMLSLVESLPASVVISRGLISVQKSLETIHLLRPVSLETLDASLAEAKRRLIYEEFFSLQVELARQYAEGRRRGRAPVIPRGENAGRLIATLPFELTTDQEDVITLLASDLKSKAPMRRLLQGDVGSGKTIVGLLLAVMVAEAGWQTAFMAPTEVLATQHFERSKDFLADVGVDSAILTGSTGAAERRSLLTRLGNGEIQVLFGTHALLTDDVVFGGVAAAQPSLLDPESWRGVQDHVPGERRSSGLALVIVDEQHKFGVEQRDALLAKGDDPHLLAMSATPIPRSLAHAMFGDLDLAVIKHKPAERQPVRTILRPRDVVDKVHSWIREKVETGEQAFIIYPLVEASTGWERRANVVDEAERLANGVYKDLKIGVLHGRMSGPDKDAVMRRFSSGEIQILCATTVVEVGVDVRNATLMVIDGADAFGLSQLHQLRGRVGRGDQASFCVLLADEQAGQPAWERLESFVSTSDGFRLAEIDLEMRGPGLFLGVRQAGAAEFRFADLLRDATLLDEARDDARRWVFGDAGA
jgi:ATP-dependent DNA helicase RecG